MRAVVVGHFVFSLTEKILRARLRVLLLNESELATGIYDGQQRDYEIGLVEGAERGGEGKRGKEAQARRIRAWPI